MNKKIYVFTVAGGPYLDLYNRFTLPSLKWDIESLQELGYDVEMALYDSHQEKVTDVSSVILPPLREMVARCVSENALMFLAPPDTVFSTRSMLNCVLAVEHKPYSVAIPHMRVICAPDKLPMGAAGMLRWALDHAHESFSNSFDSKPANCTWAGIAVRRISPSGYIMQHSLPTLYLVRFQYTDIDFWNRCPEWMQWDRTFLAKLWNEARVTVAGCSQMAFCIEITDPWNNVPHCQENVQYMDRYFAESAHNRALKSMLYYMSL